MTVSKIARGGLLAATLIQGGSGLRRQVRSEAELLSGVPVYNYDLRHLQHEDGAATGQADVFEWNLALHPGAAIEDICDFAQCKKRGHAEGVPFVSWEGTIDELRGFLKAHEGAIDFAEPDMPPQVPDDVVEEGPAAAASGNLWHLPRMGVPRAAFTGKGTHIYVMDTGVRSTHQDFGGRAIPTIDTLAGRGTPVECKGDVTCGTDYHGHGTHVASSAGGSQYGVAPQSTLHVMKVCCGAGTNTLGGMDWIVQNAEYPAIMTVSLASKGRSESSRRGVDRVVNAGIIVTVGAANDNVDTCTMTYGFIPSAISVGATDSTDRRARFSNWGPCNDIYAPGVAIFGAWNLGDADTKSISGTSMATPMVAGAAALLLQQNPSATPAKVRELLRQRSIKGIITDLKDGDPNMLLTVAA